MIIVNNYTLITIDLLIGPVVSGSDYYHEDAGLIPRPSRIF